VAGLKGSFNAFSDSKQAGVGTNKKYARIHNEGLRVQRHKVTPRVKKALRWVAGGKVFFSKGHWIKAFKMPKRTFMYISKRGQDRIEARFIVHAEKA